MNENDSVSPLARRSFLTHVGTGATILGASIAATGAPAAGAQSISGPSLASSTARRGRMV